MLISSLVIDMRGICCPLAHLKFMVYFVLLTLLYYENLTPGRAIPSFYRFISIYSGCHIHVFFVQISLERLQGFKQDYQPEK
jgi:hypothetical protein